MHGELRPSVAEVLELHRLQRRVSGHAVPLEGLDDLRRRSDLGEATLEAMLAVIGVLDEAPVSALFQLELLDGEPVAAPPPLREQGRIGHRFPDAVARRIEDAFDAQLAIGNFGELRLEWCDHGAHGSSTWCARGNPRGG